jgi:hypothetical protein
MFLLKRLWRDEQGVILSAEVVLLGSIGVIGAVVGLGTVTHAVNDELEETAFAIRSLDQSYCIRGHRGCAAWTAGSYYIQPPVRESLDRLRAEAEADLQGLREQIDAEREQMKPVDEKDKRQPKAKTKRKAEKKRNKKGPTLDESAEAFPQPNDLPNAGE